MPHHRSASAAAGLVVVACAIGSASAISQQESRLTNPGAKWTDDGLRKAVAPARVGRKLTPRKWPNDARVAVCLSFDVDNESYLLAQGETSPTTLSAADFGAETGWRGFLRSSIATRYRPPSSSRP